MPPTLLLSPRHTEDSSLLRDAALEAGWWVERLSSWRVPANFEADEPVVYGEPLFGAVVADELGLALLEPPFDWLARLPAAFVNRRVEYTDLASARGRAGRAFFKPADDKCFPAAVYDSGAEVPAHESLPAGTPVLVSEPVRFAVEYRCFVCEGDVVAHSIYARDGALAQAADGSFPAPEPEAAEALAFCARLLRAAADVTPPALVVDVGVVEGRGWSAVEANPCFGAGLYGASPAGVLRPLRRACRRAGALEAADARWVLARGEGLRAGRAPGRSGGRGRAVRSPDGRAGPGGRRGEPAGRGGAS